MDNKIRRLFAFIVLVSGLAWAVRLIAQSCGCNTPQLSIQVPLSFSTIRQNVPYVGAITSIGIPTNQVSTISVTGSLPPGTALSGCAPVTNCQISGTPTVLGANSFNLTLSLSGGTSTTAPFSLTVAQISSIRILPVSPVLGVGGTNLQAQALAKWSDGGQENDITGLTGIAWASDAPLKCTVGATTGSIAPAAAGTCNVTAAFNGVTSPNDLVTVVGGSNPVVITTTAFPLNSGGTKQAQINQSFPQFTLKASGGTGPYTWALFSGALPVGVTLDTATGIISGTPTAAGSNSPGFRATDSLSVVSATQVITLNVAVLSSISTDCLPTPGCRTMAKGSQLQFAATGTYDDASTGDVTRQLIGGGGGGALAFVNADIGSNAGSTTEASRQTANGINVVAGRLLKGVCASDNGASITATFTDTAGNTWTQIDTSTQTGGTHAVNGRLTTFYAKNVLGNSADKGTCTWSSNANHDSAMLIQYSGGDPTAPLDAHTALNSGTTQAAGCPSIGPITTTNANDVVTVTCFATNGQSWTPDTGYTIEKSDVQLAFEDQIFSTIQTGISVNLNASISNQWIATIDSFKALAGATGTAWSSDATGVATVSSTGLVSALGGLGGTANIKACIGATCGQVGITVPSTGVTSVTMSPASGSCNGAGTAFRFHLLDQNLNDLSNPPTTWGSSDTTIATVDTTGLATCTAKFGTVTITATTPL